MRINPADPGGLVPAIIAVDVNPAKLEFDGKTKYFDYKPAAEVLFQERRREAEESALDLSRALATAIDAELRSIQELSALATTAPEEGGEE